MTAVVSEGTLTGNSGETCPTGEALENTVISTRDVSDPPDYYALNSITFTGEFGSNDGDAFETIVDPTLGTCTIAGSDTSTTPGIPEVYPIGQDVYNFSLHYYSGDYQPVGSTVIVPLVLEAIPAQAAPLYNGNIAAMSVNIPQLGVPKVYNYHYDQLNRIGQLDTYNGLNNGTGVFTPVQLSDYLERAGYDPNGNILTYQRNGVSGTGMPLAMDALSYTYNANTNQLQRINDTVSASNYSQDIDDQGSGTNYTYDAIGNLKTDVASGITGRGISWTVYGKIDSIASSNGLITYTYDAAGNRITKTFNDTVTLYVRDAQGNVMSIYKQPTAGGTVQQVETDLYGSSRLGLTGVQTTAPSSVMIDPGFTPATLGTFTRGEKIFELSNHLGNVLATVTDKKIPVSSASDSSLIDHYTADLVTAQDYYPFGMEMPGRTFNNAGYRYGFNGKENDNEVKGVADQIDYGMRVYDPRIGKFLSVDPLTGKYPWYTPYQFAGNTPIQASDLDGAEPLFNLNDAHRAEKEASYALYGEKEGERQYQISRSGETWGGIAGVGFAVDWLIFGGTATKTALSFYTAWQASEVYEYTNRNGNTKNPTTRAQNSKNAASAAVDLGTGYLIGKGVSVLTKIAGEGGKAIYKYFSASSIRYSQGTVNGFKEIFESMQKYGWKGDPIDIVKMEDGIYTTVDNTRLLAAQTAVVNVKANAHSFKDLIPEDIATRFADKEGKLPKTWGEAVKNRMAKQNNVYKEDNVSGNGTFIMPKAKD